ncbi:Alpha/Beta hydrolase protein [Xylariaceae sp. FL0804]|nr:Alpha/Beta hydrolase protein [Xylariaceae sp. FL0804]
MELGLSVVLPDPSCGHTHTAIVLHDRDDTARDMADTFFMSRNRWDVFPSVRWVFPQAETRPCERDGGQERSQWYDVWNPLDFADREDLQVEGLRESVDSVRRIVAREASLVGGLRNIVLAGIGQGGATAVHTLLNICVDDAGHDKQQQRKRKRKRGEPEPPPAPPAPPPSPPPRLAGLVGIACPMALPGGTLAETREVLGLIVDVEGEGDAVVRHTPALLAHGADDPVVFVELGRVLRASLADFGVDVAWREYTADDGEGGGGFGGSGSGLHWLSSPRGVDDVAAFLAAQGLPAAPPPRIFRAAAAAAERGRKQYHHYRSRSSMSPD